MNEQDLRHSVFSEFDSILTKQVEDVFTAETDQGTLVEISSSGHSITDMIKEMAAAVRGVDADSLHVIVHHNRSNQHDRIGRLSLSTNTSDMSKEEIRVRVAHALRTE